MRYRRLTGWRWLHQLRLEENWGILLWELRIPARMLLFGVTPFSPLSCLLTTSCSRCCLDQWFTNFHTRHKQRLNMGAGTHRSSAAICGICGPQRITVMSTEDYPGANCQPCYFHLCLGHHLIKHFAVRKRKTWSYFIWNSPSASNCWQTPETMVWDFITIPVQQHRWHQAGKETQAISWSYRL